MARRRLRSMSSLSSLLLFLYLLASSEALRVVERKLDFGTKKALSVANEKELGGLVNGLDVSNEDANMIDRLLQMDLNAQKEVPLIVPKHLQQRSIRPVTYQYPRFQSQGLRSMIHDYLENPPTKRIDHAMKTLRYRDLRFQQEPLWKRVIQGNNVLKTTGGQVTASAGEAKTLTQIVTNIGSRASSIAQKVGEKLAPIVQKVGEKLAPIVQKVAPIVKKIGEKLAPIAQKVKEFVKDPKAGLKKIGSSIKNFATSGFNKAKDFVSNNKGKLAIGAGVAVVGAGALAMGAKAGQKPSSGKGPSASDIEDCTACRYAWLKVEVMVGNSQSQEEVYDAATSTFIDMQKASIFYSAADSMFRDIQAMVDDYIDGYSVNQMCENAFMCR